MSERAWNLRRTPQRDKLIESLRGKLAQSGRTVETIHGVVTTAAIFDEGLKALERELDAEPNQK
ncbi:MAG: hypothetical protein ABI690_19655 [Chloroflexota bacterium]